MITRGKKVQVVNYFEKRARLIRFDVNVEICSVNESMKKISVIAKSPEGFWSLDLLRMSEANPLPIFNRNHRHFLFEVDWGGVLLLYN